MSVVPISSRDYASKVKRPAFSVLSCQKAMDRVGIQLPSWEQGLRDYLSTQFDHQKWAPTENDLASV